MCTVSPPEAAAAPGVRPDRRGPPAAAGGAIGRWALDAGLEVLTDEVHEHLASGGVTAPSTPVVGRVQRLLGSTD